MVLSQPIELGQYRHSASKKEYTVLCEAKSSETLEPLVVYRANYDGKIWVRPRFMWNEFVDVDGAKVPRFVKIKQGFFDRLANWIIRGY